MTFQERYSQEDTWYGKVIIMELFHLTMCQRNGGWTLTKTAESFGVSIGLVSENLRLAHAIHGDDKVLIYKTRQEALRRIK